MILAVIPLECPIVKIIATRYLVDLMIEFIGASEARSLTGNYHVRVAATRGLASAMPNCGIGFSSICIYRNAVFTGSLDLKRQVRRIHFEAVVVVEMPYSHNDGTLRQFQLGGAIVEIKQGETGFRIHADRSRAGLQFSTRIFVGPQIITRS
jgi:hypothetical protein